MPVCVHRVCLTLSRLMRLYGKPALIPHVLRR
ncbi:hypothetical protein X942_5641 [Burkholderia pseudomallei MSHR5596]|nr:hypothetical protein X942_5641 [Burkholderia pseudomallei MSHR5596]